jgi:hypothetical protein
MEDMIGEFNKDIEMLRESYMQKRKINTSKKYGKD